MTFVGILVFVGLLLAAGLVFRNMTKNKRPEFNGYTPEQTRAQRKVLWDAMSDQERLALGGDFDKWCDAIDNYRLTP